MNTAQVIQFPAQASELKNQEAKGMYSDRFTQGYVMSSRLYRQEVRPYLSDAARNVYAELEDRIHGHQKDSDFISWTQLQGVGDPSARKSSLSTVRVGLAMLLANGVVSIVDSGKQGVKKYQINEVSLVGKKIIKPSEKDAANYFGNRSTTENEVLRKPKQTTTENEVNHYGNRSETTSENEDTIDIKISLDSLEFKKRDLPVDKPESKMFDDSVKYHEDNSSLYSLRELASKYPVQFDFQAQAKKLNPELNENLVFSELKNFAQWSTGRQKTTAQNWMNFWIYRIQKLKSPSAAPQKAKRLSLSQIRTFSSKLCSLQRFASEYSNVGETQKQFESRIAEKLGNPENITAWASYLREVGFVGKLEGFA